MEGKEWFFRIPTSVIQKLRYGFLIDLKWNMIDKVLSLSILLMRTYLWSCVQWFWNIMACCIQFIKQNFELKWTKFTSKWILRAILTCYGKSNMTQSVTDCILAALCLEAGQQNVRETQFDAFMCSNLMFFLVCFLFHSAYAIVSSWGISFDSQYHSATHWVYVCALCMIQAAKHTKKKASQ